MVKKVFNLFLFTISDLVYYIISGFLALAVLFGIFLMSKVEKARLGNGISTIAIFIAIVLTIVKKEIIPVWAIYPAIVVGAIIGLVWARRVKMIQMPQLVAIFNGIGGGASAIVASLAYIGVGSGDDVFSKITSLIAIAIGMITLFGSLIAAGKLHKVLPQKPIIFPKHQFLTFFFLFLVIINIILGSLTEVFNYKLALFLLLALSSVFGLVFSIRVGGADMPITISLLNSLSGVAGAIAGLAINDILLVSIGSIVGASGLILTRIMCKAMNRSLISILLGKTTVSNKQVNEVNLKIANDNTNTSDPLKIINSAKKIIIVPGYGMAIAQAQHLVKQLADKIIDKGIDVKFAIHPVA